MLMLGMSFSVLELRVWGVVVNARKGFGAGIWYARFANGWDSGVDPGRKRWMVVRRAAIVVGLIVDVRGSSLLDQRWMFEADFCLVKMISF